MGCIGEDCMYWNFQDSTCVIYKRLPRNRECKMAHSVAGMMNSERPNYGY